MADPKTMMLLLYLVVGVLMVAASVPLIRGRVRPNAVYGFRVRRTMASADVWYPANRYAAWRMAGVGVGVVVAAGVGYALPGVDFVRYALICGGALAVGLALALVQSFRYLRTLRG